MKKLFIFLLILIFLDAKTIVVDKSYVGWFASTCTDGDYKTNTIADGLANADNGDEIIICPGRNNRKASYNESNLNINNTDLYIHSYNDDPSKVEVYDNSGNPIFNVKSNGTTIEGLTITQNSNQEDINVTATDINLKDSNITSQGEGIYIYGDLQNSTFNDVNITSSGRCIDAVGAVFKNVTIKKSDFNQTASGKWAFVTYANPFEDNNFSDINLTSEGYGLYFASGLKDSNFTRVDANSSDDFFVVNSGDMNNIRFNDVNFSSDNGRSISINNGNLLNSYFDDMNLSANYEALYVDSDISNTTFNNFIIKGTTGIYGNNYIKNTVFENGEINASDTGIYSSKEFNQSKLDNLEINATNYGLYFSKKSKSGAVNDENNLTNLLIIQTSDGSGTDSGIRFKKKVNNSIFDDVNISAVERGVWLSTGGENNTFSNSEFNSSESIGFRNSNLLQNNSFSNINIYSYKEGLSFYGDTKNNNFDNLYIESNDSDGIYGTTDINISDNNFTNFTIKADDYGVYFKDSTSDNNFTNFYSRVNKYSFKFAKYSTNDYFLNMDLNGTKGIDFNISKSDVVENANIITTQNEPIYFDTIESPVVLSDLNLTSTKDNCIYVSTLDADLNITTKNFTMNECNASNYYGIQLNSDSDYALNIKDTNFTFNGDANNKKALIWTKNIKELNVTNCILNPDNKRRGIYINGSVDDLYINNSSFADTNDSGVYVKTVNNSFDIEDNNFSDSSGYGIYIGAIGSNFSKGEIKKNYFQDNSDYAVDIFKNNETDNDNINVWYNCFYNNQNNSGDSQAYTYDSNAKYDDGSSGNYWSDWNSSVSSTYQIDPSDANLYDNHPLNYCPVTSSKNKSWMFDARDVFRDYNDTNISTKIVNKDFNLTIASYDENKSKLQDFNGTVCVEVIDDNDNNLTSWKKMTDFLNDVNESNWTNINISSARKKAKVTIQWKKNVDEDCPLSSDYNETNSSDDFALRPDKFIITNIPPKIYAGEEFNLTLKALDYKGNPAKDYNESVYMSGNSADLEYNISKSGCFDGNLTKLSDENFTNGEVNVTLKYDEVGDVNLTLKEVNGSEFAKVDEDDTNKSERFIEENKTVITVFPHHFEINVNVSNFDNNFTYLDNNLTVYSLIDLNITAENEQNQTTKNYNTKCYAKNIDVNLTPDVFRHNNKLSKNVLYKIFYIDSNSSIYKNSDVNFSVGEGNFSTDYNGSALIKLHINFDKNISNPQDPFEYNISSAEVNDSDTNLTYSNLEGNSTFYYGNIYMSDIITYKNDFNISQKILMYDNNSSDTYKPNSNEVLLNWYHNLFNHLKDANISNFVVTKGYVYNKNDVINSVTVKVNDINDSVNLNIERNNSDIDFVVVHIIDSNASHLWYSKYGNEYNISQGSSCVNHFCFTVTWPKDTQESGVLSGEINGTKADVNESNETLKGVKIFR